MHEFDFFDTPITPYTVLKDQAEVEIHIRDTETMEQRGVRAIVAMSPEQLPDADGARRHQVAGATGRSDAERSVRRARLRPHTVPRVHRIRHPGARSVDARPRRRAHQARGLCESLWVTSGFSSSARTSR